jgi:seryl-tRNA synthetase
MGRSARYQQKFFEQRAYYETMSLRELNDLEQKEAHDKRAHLYKEIDNREWNVFKLQRRRKNLQRLIPKVKSDQRVESLKEGVQDTSSSISFLEKQTEELKEKLHHLYIVKADRIKARELEYLEQGRDIWLETYRPHRSEPVNLTFKF